jgi:hypothetical protein
MSAACLMLPGVDEQAAREKQAAFYKQRDPTGSCR